MQTHLVPKIMHQNLAIILQHFNYANNSFIVLVPDHNERHSFCWLVTEPGDEQLDWPRG